MKKTNKILLGMSFGICLLLSLFINSTEVEAQQTIAQSDLCLKKGHWEHAPLPGRPVVMVCDNTGNSFCARPCETIIVSQ